MQSLLSSSHEMCFCYIYCFSYQNKAFTTTSSLVNGLYLSCFLRRKCLPKIETDKSCLTIRPSAGLPSVFNGCPSHQKSNWSWFQKGNQRFLLSRAKLCPFNGVKKVCSNIYSEYRSIKIIECPSKYLSKFNITNGAVIKTSQFYCVQDAVHVAAFQLPTKSFV
jgi:hypothetical protein